MRFILLFLMGAIVVPRAAAQERWQQLPGAAQAYAVDLQSLARKGDILEARIRTHDVGSRIVVQDVQARCAMNQLRTVGCEKLYDEDTGRPLPPPWQAISTTAPRGLNTKREVKDMLCCPVCARSPVSRTSRNPREHSLRAA